MKTRIFSLHFNAIICRVKKPRFNMLAQPQKEKYENCTMITMADQCIVCEAFLQLCEEFNLLCAECKQPPGKSRNEEKSPINKSFARSPLHFAYPGRWLQYVRNARVKRRLFFQVLLVSVELFVHQLKQRLLQELQVLKKSMANLCNSFVSNKINHHLKKRKQKNKNKKM